MIAISLMTLSTLLLLILGVLHLVYTFSGPKLTPRDPALQARMSEVHLVITRQTTMWRAWIGFNASHSMGTILPFLLVVGFAMLGGLAVLARRYWFRVPFAGVVAALGCYVLSIVAWRVWY